MKMPFGKHKGRELSYIIKNHPEYIVWLAENCDLRDELKVIVTENYKKCLKASPKKSYPTVEKTWGYDKPRGWSDADDEREPDPGFGSAFDRKRSRYTYTYSGGCPADEPECNCVGFCICDM